MTFNITSTKNNTLEKALQEKIDLKTKPQGALGSLEQIAFQIGSIQQTETPKILNPTIAVFAGDHGIAKKGEVNPYPQEVTAQMVYNFVNGGAAINVFSKTNRLNLKIIDAGVNHKFESNLDIIDAKIGLGTKNYQYEPAMSIDLCQEAIKKGSAIIEQIKTEGCNTIGFGEMGIGNTSSASLLMSYFTKIPITECVGSGTGLDTNGINTKQVILSKVFKQYEPKTPIEALAIYGGFEIAMLVGAILKAAELKMTLLIDGFIVTAALLVAKAMHTNVIEYCIFSHNSNEQGHKKMLGFFKVKPLLSIGLRLGEGTGAALAVPLLQASVDFLNEMASFETANVSEKQI